MHCVNSWEHYAFVFFNADVNVVATSEEFFPVYLQLIIKNLTFVI